MMDVKSAVLFSAAEQLSDELARMGEHTIYFGNRARKACEHIGALAEGLVGFGEWTALTGTLISKGAAKLHQWIEALQDPAAEVQKKIGTMAAMTGLAGDQFETINARVADFAAIYPEAAAEQWFADSTRIGGIFRDVAQAMRSEDISAMLSRLGLESRAATRTIQLGWSNLHTGAATTRDQFTRSLQAFGLVPEQANQWATAVGRMEASAAAAHAPFSQVLALSGDVQRLWGSSRGATMFASTMLGLENAAANGKAEIDCSHDTVAASQLKPQITDTRIKRKPALQEVGVSNAPMMLKLLDSLDNVATKQKQIGDSAGALSKTYGTATANISNATQRLHRNWSKFADSLDSPGFGTRARATNPLSHEIEDLSKLIEDYSKMTGVLTIALTGLGAGAQWKPNIALWPMVPTIGTAAAAVAVLPFTANEVYEHWVAGSSFFEKLWRRIKEIIGEAVDWMTVGAKLAKAHSEGILAAVECPVKAAESLAGKIGGFFRLDSPPADRVLREAILHCGFGEGLAKHFQPTALIRDTQKMAAGIVAAQIAKTAAPAPFPFPQPSGRPAARPSAGPITINYAPVIKGALSPDEWVKAARQHADELMRIIGAKLSRQARLEFG
jgi:hypothetical protein